MKNLDNVNLIDISSPLDNGMDTHSSMESYERKWIRRIGEESSANLSVYSMISHVGTHVDAPFHFYEDGEKLDNISIKRLMGKAQIISVENSITVSGEFLKNTYKNTDILLFKFGSNRYDRKYDYFDESAIKFLALNNVKAIGTDNVTVDSINSGYKIHRLIFKNNILIIPGLVLDCVNMEKVYSFICLPILIKDSEAAPGRAILIEE